MSVLISLSFFLHSLHLRYIAMITKLKAFNKSLIDQQTQVIFLDEAYAGLLDPDDWKVGCALYIFLCYFCLSSFF